MNSKIQLFCETLYQRDLISKEQITREILRVKKTKMYIEKEENDKSKIERNPDKLFDKMKEKIEVDKLGYFPGDRDLFFKLYELGKDIDILEFIIEIYKNDRSGTIIAPRYLTDYMINLISERKPNKILITDAEKSLVGLREVVDKFLNKRFYLTTQNLLMYEVLKLAFLEYDNVNIIHQSIYSKLFLKEKFDLILCLPIFGGKQQINELGHNFIVRETEGIAAENLLNFITEDGFLYIIVPAKFIFSGGNFIKLRKYITDKYNVDSIFILPEGTFRPFTGIKTYMICISNVKKNYIEIGNFILVEDKFVLKDKKKVNATDFKKSDDWRIDLFFTENYEDIIKYKESNVAKIKLKDIAEIFRGKSIMRKDIKPGEIMVLNISDIEDGEIVFDNMDTIDEEERKVKRYELQDGDIVITCRGTVNKVAVYKDNSKKVIASANIIVIRLKDKFISDYVKIFLESPIGTTLIKSFQRGSVVMNINPKDIGELEIPYIEYEQQRKIVDEYYKELELYKATIKKAEKRWKDKKTEIYNSLIM